MSGNSLSHRIALGVSLSSLLACAIAVTMHDTASTASPFSDAYPEIAARMDADIRIHPGMTVAQVQEFAVELSAASRSKSIGTFRDSAAHNYAFLSFNQSDGVGIDIPVIDPDVNSLTYLINGSLQCWLDIAFKDGRVQNIYATPGNMTVVFPSKLWRGSGAHRGQFATVAILSGHNKAVNRSTHSRGN